MYQRRLKLHCTHHQHVLAEPRAHLKGHKRSEGIKLLEGLGVAGVVNKLVDPQKLADSEILLKMLKGLRDFRNLTSHEMSKHPQLTRTPLVGPQSLCVHAFASM